MRRPSEVRFLATVSCLLVTACNCGDRVAQVRVTVDVSPRTVDFGVQEPGRFTRRTVTFTAHEAQATIDRMMLRDDVRGSFTLGTVPMKLVPEVPVAVEVVYGPQSEGADSALLVTSFIDVADELTVPVVGRAQVGAPADAGMHDAGNDAGLGDAGIDAGLGDAGSDAGLDDAGSDAGLGDAGSDAGLGDAGSDAGLSDAGLDAGESTDAGFDGGLLDAGSRDSGVPFDAGGEYGPPNCPVASSLRDVSTAGLPSLTWVGSGYAIAVDERAGSSWEVSLQRTDARGVLVAGPSPITPRDGYPSLWPSVSFSGLEYGITWLDDRPPGRRAFFARVDRNLQVISGSELTLSTGTSAISARVAWNSTFNQWGVAWYDNQGLFFERFDSAGTSLSRQNLGARSLSDAGNPLVATPTGWALVTTGTPTVIELGSGAPSFIPLPGSASRASIAFGAGQLAVVFDTSMQRLTFLRVQNGAIVPNSQLSLGTVAAYGPSVPSLGWTGSAFLAVWSETSAGFPRPLLRATIAPGTTTSTIAGTPLTTRSNAGFNSLAIGSCGFGVTYGVFSPLPDTLEVWP